MPTAPDSDYFQHCLLTTSEGICPQCIMPLGLSGTAHTYCIQCHSYWLRGKNSEAITRLNGARNTMYQITANGVTAETEWLPSEVIGPKPDPVIKWPDSKPLLQKDLDAFRSAWNSITDGGSETPFGTVD